MAVDFRNFGSYRIGVNLPMDKMPVWEKVARAARWGAPVIEINDQVERIGNKALDVIRDLAQVNELKYTMHIPPAVEQSGELAVPDKRQNKFAREVFAQALKAAGRVGAKHITFHPTLQAGRPPEDVAYVYDKMEDKVSGVRIPIGMERDEYIKMMNESKKVRLNTQINRLESDLNLLKGMEDSAEIIARRGVNTDNAIDLMNLTSEAFRKGSQIGIHPEDWREWSRIQKKVFTPNQRLTEHEKKVVRDYAERVNRQTKDYRVSIGNQLKEVEHFKGADLVFDGEEKMKQNVAENIAAIPKDVLRDAMKSGISIGIENLPGNQLFSTPEEMTDIRNKIISELVKKGFSRKAVQDFVGFTFDFGHAVTAKYFEAGGKKYSVPGFVEALDKGAVKHIHVTDAIGVIDGHLPLGHGEVTKDDLEKVEKAVRKSGLTAVHELGAAGIPQLYHASMRFYEPGMYHVGDEPTSSFWGPTYLSAAMTDPITMQKEGGYFYESFVDLF